MSIDADIKQIQDRTDAVESSVREWAENQIRDLEELAVNAAADLQRLAGEKQDAESEVARLTALVHAQRDDVAVQQKEKRRLEEELANVIAHQKSLPSKIENLKLKMAEIQATIRQKTLAKESEEQKASRRLAEMKSAISAYTDALGLSFELESGMMRFSIKNVDENNPDAELCFLLHLENGKYRVYSCTPQLPTVDEMAAELEATEDLRYFVQRMRRAFKAYLQSNV